MTIARTALRKVTAVCFAVFLATGATAEPIRVEGFTFPDRIDGVERGSVHDFEKTHPGLGSRVEYLRSGWLIHVFVYNGGLTSVPSDIQSDTIKSQFEQAKGDVFTLQDRGTYAGVRVERQYTINDAQGRPRLLCATFSYEHKGWKQNVASVLCVGGRDNKFLKFRVTLPQRSGAEADARRFVEAWRALL